MYMSNENKIGSVRAVNAQEALEKLREQHPELLAGAPKNITQWLVPKLAIVFDGIKDDGLHLEHLVANPTLRNYVHRLAAQGGETEERELQKLIEQSLHALLQNKNLHTLVTWAA